MTTDNDARQQLTDAGEQITIPVIKERAIVDKLNTVTGTVTVNVVPGVKTVSESIDLRHVQYREERHPIDRIVEVAPEVRQEGNTTIISVIREEAVVVKRLRLVEEIHLIREERTETVTEQISLREDAVTIVRD